MIVFVNTRKQMPIAATPKRQALESGFSLFELLCVLAIMSLIVAVTVLALPSLKSAREITSAAEDISGVLERARSLAMARSTYVWVGFFEESASGPAGQAGTGKLILSVVASKDGTRLYQDGVTTPTQLDSNSLEQVSKLVTIPRMHLDVLSPSEITRTDVPANTYQVGSTEFEKTGGSAIPVTFSYPLSGTPTYTFIRIIEFNPLGDASKIVDSPTRWMEIGLRRARGNATDTDSKNVIAIQLAGIGGQVSLLRP
jgi:prepilin-type N-terminal cleavage/methylation domain-containing protein